MLPRQLLLELKTDLFQRHVRWKTVSAKNGYIEDKLTSRFSVSKISGIYVRVLLS